MNKTERKKLKKRLLNAAGIVAQEFNICRKQRDSNGAKDARERWQILFRAATDIDNFKE